MEEMEDMSSTCSVPQTSTRNLVQEIETNMMAYWAWIFSSPFSKVEDEEDFLRLSCDVPEPMCNYVFRSRFPDLEVGRRIEETLDFFRMRNLPMSWMVGPCCRPTNIGEQLVSHGLAHPHEHESVGMTIDLMNLNENLPAAEGVTIRRVTNDSDMKDFIKPFGEGFGFPDAVTTTWGRMDSSHGFHSGLPRINYVAMVDGEPASCTTVFETPSSAGIYCVATVPEKRRRGAASALIVNALREARDDGYRLGLLQAKAAGAGVYRKIGFVDQPCKIGWYMWQPGSEVRRGGASSDAAP